MAPAATAKKQTLTFKQLANYDDILTDALVDHVYYWTNIPKNREAYHSSRGIREEDIANVIQSEIVVNKDIDAAESKLLALDGLRKFGAALKTPAERQDFRQHLRRYVQIYMPDCPWEVNTTNRYTIVSQEASVTARRYIRRNETIKYLAGISVSISPEEERALADKKRNFSIVVSARNRSMSLFMGPARFANHDCDANAKLMTTGHSGIEIVAKRDIDEGEEITVSYGIHYFGENNCDCLCQTCENNRVNGWAPAEGETTTEDVAATAHAPKTATPEVDSSLPARSLRKRRRDESGLEASRTPSVAPELRPRIFKTKRRNLHGAEAPRMEPLGAEALQMEPLGATAAQSLRPEGSGLGISGILETMTPPITPSKRDCAGLVHHDPTHATVSISSSSNVSERSASVASLDNTAGTLTDATTPPDSGSEKHSPEPMSTALVGSEDCVMAESPAEQTGHHFSSEHGTQLVKLENAPVVVLMEGTADAAQLADVPHMAISDALAPSHPSVVKSEDATPTTLGSANDATQQATAPPCTAASAAATTSPANVMVSVETVEETSVATKDQPPKRRRGRPKFSGTSDDVAAKRQSRTPGDYTLTPLLLSKPDMAWIHCTNCKQAFVQEDAYFTRSSCPRCERHSKLYGYMWPKADKAGPDDTEERVLDHRTVHRFLDRGDEARIRGRQIPAGYRTEDERLPEGQEAKGVKMDDGNVGGSTAPVRRGPGRPRITRAHQSNQSDEVPDAKRRRSGRERRASLKASMTV